MGASWSLMVTAAGAELVALAVFLAVVLPVKSRFPVHGSGLCSKVRVIADEPLEAASHTIRGAIAAASFGGLSASLPALMCLFVAACRFGAPRRSRYGHMADRQDHPTGERPSNRRS